MSILSQADEVNAKVYRMLSIIGARAKNTTSVGYHVYPCPVQPLIKRQRPGDSRP